MKNARRLYAWNLLRQYGCQLPTAAMELFVSKPVRALLHESHELQAEGLRPLRTVLGLFDPYLKLRVRRDSMDAPLRGPRHRVEIAGDGCVAPLIVAPQKRQIELEIDWRRGVLRRAAGVIQQSVRAVLAWWQDLDVDRIIWRMRFRGTSGVIAAHATPQADVLPRTVRVDLRRCTVGDQLMLASIDPYKEIAGPLFWDSNRVVVSNQTLDCSYSNSAPIEVDWQYQVLTGRNGSSRQSVQFTAVDECRRLTFAAADRRGDPLRRSDLLIEDVGVRATQHPIWRQVWTVHKAAGNDGGWRQGQSLRIRLSSPEAGAAIYPHPVVLEPGLLWEAPSDYQCGGREVSRNHLQRNSRLNLVAGGRDFGQAGLQAIAIVCRSFPWLGARRRGAAGLTTFLKRRFLGINAARWNLRAVVDGRAGRLSLRRLLDAELEHWSTCARRRTTQAIRLATKRVIAESQRQWDAGEVRLATDGRDETALRQQVRTKNDRAIALQVCVDN